MVKKIVFRVHVRRTDKSSEAEYRDLKDYMYHVERWFDRYDRRTGRTVERKVYLATDEPHVSVHARKM